MSTTIAFEAAADEEEEDELEEDAVGLEFDDDDLPPPIGRSVSVPLFLLRGDAVVVPRFFVLISGDPH